MQKNLFIYITGKWTIILLFIFSVIPGCNTSREGSQSPVVPAKLTAEDNDKLRQILAAITNAPVNDTILIKHYHSHDDCWSTYRYRVAPDVLGSVMRLNKWLETYAAYNPHITVLQIRQPGSGPLKYIKRNYNVKVDIKKALLQFPMFSKQDCNVVWLIMPDGTLYQINARY